MRRIILALLLALCAGSHAYAQGTIVQSGPVVAFHAGSWFQNGVLGDAGMPLKPFLNAIGMFNGSSCPFSISSQTSPGTYTSSFSQFSICQTNTVTTLTIQGLNGQATPILQFNIGGTIYDFPGSGNGDVIGPSSSTAGDIACYGTTTGKILADCGPSPNAFREIASGTTDVAVISDATIAWKSSSTSAKTETLYACTSGRKGFQVYIKDEIGTAATYPITVATNGSDTIDNGPLYYLAYTLVGNWFQCNGAGNWITK